LAVLKKLTGVQICPLPPKIGLIKTKADIIFYGTHFLRDRGKPVTNVTLNSML